MTMAKTKEDQIFVQEGDEVIELTGSDKEAFLADREATAQAQASFEAEVKAKQQARKDAIKKLAESAGLTEEELNAIL
jgi:isocitrate dehydrogenase kinase/phosphatase